MAHRGKAAHITCFPHNRLGHNRPDALDGLQLLIGGCVLQTRLHALFQGCICWAVSLAAAEKYRRLTPRLSQEQEGLDERALMVSQRPSHLW